MAMRYVVLRMRPSQPSTRPHQTLIMIPNLVGVVLAARCIVCSYWHLVRHPLCMAFTGEQFLCSHSTRFSLAEILVLACTASADGMTTPTITRVSVRLEHAHGHTLPVNIVCCGRFFRGLISEDSSNQLDVRLELENLIYNAR